MISFCRSRVGAGADVGAGAGAVVVPGRDDPAERVATPNMTHRSKSCIHDTLKRLIFSCSWEINDRLSRKFSIFGKGSHSTSQFTYRSHSYAHNFIKESDEHYGIDGKRARHGLGVAMEKII
jgi:hypothetical protein